MLIGTVAVCDSHDTREVADVYAEYQAQLRLNNSFDFDDLLTVCEDLFVKHPEVVAGIEHVLVDEFQA